ncbi:MAG: hypothetical protein FWF77_04350 [Defluviitaleaceae bacterium]|nr:hypothetical protein [Defluviitaleaceae bacterium]
MQISNLLPPAFAGRINEMKENERAFFVPCDEDADEDELCMVEKLRAAVEEYRDKVLRGLNALSEEEIQERIADFRLRFEPITEEQIAEFERLVAEFESALRDMEKNGRVRLLVSSSETDEGEYARSLMPSNLPLQRALIP